MAIDDQESRSSRANPRKVFLIVAVVLALLLVGLIIYLVWFLGRPEVLSDRQSKQGIQPIWQVFGPAAGEAPFFERPMGVAVGKSDRIYVTDSGNDRVCVFDSSGRFLFAFGGTGIIKPATGVKPTYAPGALNYPVGIDTDEAGNVYVASFNNDCIEVFESDGTPIRTFPDPLAVTGKGGSGRGGTGIAVTDVAVRGNRVFATDQYQVLVFTLEGELVKQWGRPGSGPDGLDHPNGIAVSEDGNTVYVSDSNNNRVTAFSADGEVRWHVGTIAQSMDDRTPRAFQLPRGLAVMPDGSVLVADAFGFSLVRISADGEVVGEYGERGVEPGQLNFVNDVAPLRGFVLIADKENDRVQLVRLID